MLRGLMMDRPLLVSSVIDYAADVFPDVEVVSQTIEGGLHRYGYAQARARIGRLANALLALGVKPGDRVATLAWNGYRHFELYFAIAGIGAVCHTINPRLFPDQIAYIANHAADSVLFFDLTFQPLVEKLAPACKTITSYVLMTDRAHMPANPTLAPLLCYEELLAATVADFSWPEFDEHAACALCYTSGTTGEPKGVLYSNRSMLLHTFFLIATRPDLFAHNRTILPVVPLFHANAWSLPYVTPLTGCPLILPGAKLDGPTLFELMDNEAVEAGWGVPTVWLGLLEEFNKRGRKPKHLVQILSGGSAVPAAMIDTFSDWGIDVTHGWGMTEMSPVGTITVLRPAERAKPPKERAAFSARQGRRMFGVDLKVIDDKGNRAPPDGETSGELFVRGATVVSGYFNNPEASARQIDGEGWFGTGDVAKLTPDGWLLIVDRTKDLVKSGGEWISSIDVENAALAAVKGIANCAVIGVPHPKWNERPLLVAVKAPGAEPTKAQILDALSAKIAPWQMPDDVVFVEALPMTATGKISKKDLRAQFASYPLPG
ncbi:MAG TPA: long-chain-fatty-acid--CoA ligase [Hyphomicrobiaceae bacterium]|nr:long-chain-fatty-acid--CoA ligase [Hyphomicrobiaceae bacterium]